MHSGVKVSADAHQSSPRDQRTQHHAERIGRVVHALISGSFSVITLRFTSASDKPRKGNRPMTMRKRTTPNDHTSIILEKQHASI